MGLFYLMFFPPLSVFMLTCQIQNNLFLFFSKMSSKVLLPVALGVSLVSVTAFVVYYIFKKDEDETADDRKSIKTSKVNVIEIKIPKSIVPALIGKKLIRFYLE